MKILCPICANPLQRIQNTATCENRHSFDYAKQGYLNLLIKQSVDHGDNKEMVQARTTFLESGGYAFLKEKISDISQQENIETFMDLGCGEGYYTSCIQASHKVGFDMSKEALKHASRIDHSTQYIVASIFHLPLEDASIDLGLTCFAPFAKEEIERTLRKNGRFIFVSPGPRHLYELKEILYDTPYENELKPLDTSLTLEEEMMISQPFTVNHEQLIALFQMTPYYRRTKVEDMEKLSKINALTITAEFYIRVFRKTCSA